MGNIKFKTKEQSINEKEDIKSKIKAEYAQKAQTKPLTDKERIERIEKLLEII